MILRLFRLSRVYGKGWQHWVLGAFLFYGITSVLLVPVLARQFLLPAIVSQTGVTLNADAISWHPYQFKLEFGKLSAVTNYASDSITAETLAIDFGFARSLFHQALAFDALTVQDLSFAVHTTEDGKTNIDAMIAGIQQQHTKKFESSENTHWRVLVDHIDITGQSLNYEAPDNQPPLLLSSIVLTVKDYMSWEQKKVPFVLKLQLDTQTHLKIDGSLLSDGSEGNFAIDARNIDLSRLQPLIPQSLDLPDIEGELDFSGQIQMHAGEPYQVQIEQIQSSLRNLKLTRASFNDPVITLGNLAVKSASIDVPQHRIEMETVELKDLGILSMKTRDGLAAWEVLIPRSLRDEATSSKSGDDKGTSAPWRMSVNYLEMRDVHLLPKPEEELQAQPDFRLGLWTGKGLIFDFASKSFEAEKISGENTKILFALENEGLLPLDQLTPLNVRGNPNPRISEGGAGPWAIRIEQTDISKLSLGIIRLSEPNPTPLELKELAINLGSVNTQETTETPVIVTSEVSSGGDVAIKGSFNVHDQTINGDVTLNRIGLEPLTPLISESFRLDTVEGFLTAQFNVKMQRSGEEISAEYGGHLRLEDLRLTQPPGARKLLALESLAADGITGQLNPPTFSATEIRVVNPDGVIAIREDKASNLSDLRVSPSTGSASELHTQKAGLAQKPDPDIKIRRIRIEGGKLDYSDFSLILPFRTQIVDLKGAITGWTMEPNGKSLMELNGRIAPYGEAAIHGQLRPQNPKSSMAIDLHFENVILAALTPYSATFAGRKIEDGKLDLNAHYQFEDQQLKSENHIFLKQLRLGDKVESPKAISLPLDLAVALLSDTEGNIDLSLPIEGRTDAPDFDYGTIVLNAFGNLIKKSVLSPFTTLSSVLGFKDADGLDAVAFDFGRDVLTPPEREKVGRLNEALMLKPQLQLTINGVYEPKEDEIALRQSWLREEVSRRLKVNIKPGEDPDPVNPSEPATQKVLEALAKDSDILNAALVQYEKEHGHPPDRIGLVNRLFGKGSQTPDFYEALLKSLVEHAPIHNASLQQLAQRRMDVVKDALTSSKKPIAATRIRMGMIQENSSADGHHLQMPLTLQLD